jgi:hypothetical protein
LPLGETDMIRIVQTIAVLATATLAATAAAPNAHAGKVIVLAVDGDHDGELEDGLSAIVEDRHDLVTSSQVERAARKAHIDDLDGPAIVKLARKLGADAVVVGAMTREDEGFLLTVRIRSNSGKTVKKISVDLRKPRLSAKAKKRLGLGIYDGIDKVLGLEDEDIEIDDDADTDTDARHKARKHARELGDEDADDEDRDDDDGERVAARDDVDEDDDIDRELGVRKHAGVREEDAARMPAITVGIGPSAVMRQLTFSSRDYEQAPTGYKSSMVPGARVAVEAYPLALKSHGPLAGLGVGLEYDQTLLLTTQSSDAPGVKLPTAQQHWVVDARYRFAVGSKASSPQVTLSAGYGRRTFIVDRSSLPEGAELDMPDVDYRFYNPGLAIRMPIGARAGVHVGGEALLFKAAGYIQRASSYGGAKLTGLEARGGVDFKATDKIIVDVTGSFTQIGFVFVGNGDESNNRDLDPTTVDVGGASDRYMGVVGTVGYMY